MQNILIFIFCFIFSCTQMPTKVDESKISPNVKQGLDEARSLIKSEDTKQAIVVLNSLNDATLSPVEISLKYNLKGLTLFKINELSKAISSFKLAEKHAPENTQLYGQIQFNLASTYYLLNDFNKLDNHLSKINLEILTDEEKVKYAKLGLSYAKKNQNHKIIVESSLIFLKDSRSFSDVTDSSYYPDLKFSFSKLSPIEKKYFFEKNGREKNLAISQLIVGEIEEMYAAGDRSGAHDLYSLLKSNYSDSTDVIEYLKTYELRYDNVFKINSDNIGIVLPLSGEKSEFGKKVLNGIENGLKILDQKTVKIHTKDSANSSEQAIKAVIELISDHKVAFIIGGLFPDTATFEYLEAKKYGVLYISLSQINLPKEEKNQHLIEVQGSIESQIETLFSDKMISKFGTRLGIIFPDNESGKTYLTEIWRKALIKNLEITSLSSFTKKTHDFRETVQLFLGLKYPRERSEELKILDDVYSFEKTSIRRLQTLPPVVDFDWIFMATLPHETIQLIPTLGYYDASRLKIVGGPSWVSKSLAKEQKNLGTLYFVGDDPNDFDAKFLEKFKEINNKRADLIEILALDAIKIGVETLFVANNVDRRDEFDQKLRTAGKIGGVSAEWFFQDGIWLKRMNPMAISKSGITKLFN